MKRFIPLLMILLFLPGISDAQDEGDTTIVISILTKKMARKQRPHFIGIGVGQSFSHFRDQATSPLFYEGVPYTFSLYRERKDDFREARFGLDYSTGTHAVTVNDFMATSNLNSGNIYYTQLYRIPCLSERLWHMKAGLTAMGTLNVRENYSLGNNYSGIDAFASLMGTAKAEFDLSNDETIKGKIWFLKYRFRPRKRHISWQMHFALMNTQWRNGYIYTSPNLPMEEYTVFGGHELRVFAGYRMQSSLDYTHFFRKNKNAIRFSYVWDFTQSSKDPAKFEMAKHMLHFALLFRVN